METDRETGGKPSFQGVSLPRNYVKYFKYIYLHLQFPSSMGIWSVDLAIDPRLEIQALNIGRE
jgi:hypothetical protein